MKKKLLYIVMIGIICGFGLPNNVLAFTFNRSVNTSAKDLVKKISDKNIVSTNEVKHGTVYTFTDGKEYFGINSGIILDTSGVYNDEYIDPDLKKLVSGTKNVLVDSYNKLSTSQKDELGFQEECESEYGEDCDVIEYLTALYDEERGGHTSSIEFEMTATGKLLNFNYIFLSSEFTEYPMYNDVFGLFVSVNDGKYENIALVQKDDKNYVPVNISTLRAGLSGIEMFNGLLPRLEEEDTHTLFTASDETYLYNSCVENEGCPEDDNGYIEYNGMSNIFNAQKTVKVGDKVKVKMVIADATDTAVDSYVLIQADSLSFEPKYKVNYEENEIENISVVNSSLENSIPLTIEEKELLENSELVNLRLVIKDVTETISEIDKNLIDKKLNKDKVAFYFDASMFKKVGSLEEVQLDVLTKNIKLTYLVEDKYLNKDKTKTRIYNVIRVHDGIAEVINSSFDENNNVLTFETDRFSSYALIYKDVDKKQEINPNTGDNIILYIVIGIISLIGIGGLIVIIRKLKSK